MAEAVQHENGAGGEEPSPIALSGRAIQQISRMMSEDGLSPDTAALRVAVIGGGCSGLTYKLAFEEKEPRRRDGVFLIDGVRLYVDRKSAMYLSGTELDFIDGLAGTGFVFNNPNAKSTCGCGTSFTV